MIFSFVFENCEINNNQDILVNWQIPIPQFYKILSKPGNSTKNWEVTIKSDSRQDESIKHTFFFFISGCMCRNVGVRVMVYNSPYCCDAWASNYSSPAKYFPDGLRIPAIFPPYSFHTQYSQKLQIPSRCFFKIL